MISINSNKGMHFEFSNGNVISIQIGYGNYCENKENPQVYYGMQWDQIKSKDAEIAIFDSSGRWYDFENNKFKEDNTTDVKGYVPSDEVFEWIEKCRKGEL